MATVPTKKKKKNKKSARDAGDAASMLAMHGAKFMSMFDDADDDAAARPRNEKKRKRAMSAGDDDAGDDDDDDDDALDGGDDGGAKTKTKTKTKTTKGDGDGDGDDDDAARVRTAARASSSSSTRAKDAAAAAAVETVVFGGDRPNAHASRSQASASGHVVGVSRAKKLFMSDKVGLVHEVASNPNRGGRPEAAAAAASATTKSGKNSEMENSEMGRVEGLTGASLNDMRRKVQNFGAQGLNKWDRRALDARQKTENNQKAERGVRIPMHIGVGMWKKVRSLHWFPYDRVGVVNAVS